MAEKQFLRKDLEALLDGEKLMDGEELFCGFVRIAADGLLMDYSAKLGEEPLFNMNFNSGKPVLPFPFTLNQFHAFCTWHPLFRWEAIERPFTIDDGTADNEALAELDGRSFNAGEMVRSILNIPIAPVVTVSASDGVEPDKAGPAKPLQRTAAQDAAILGEIKKQGYERFAIPKNPPGKPGAKAAIRNALSENSLFTGGTVFDKAWERLTANVEIAIKG